VDDRATSCGLPYVEMMLRFRGRQRGQGLQVVDRSWRDVLAVACLSECPFTERCRHAIRKTEHVLCRSLVDEM
jgi:hypothetical protein